MAKKATALGHRERQLVETVYRLGEASVSDVLAEISDPPSYSSVRAMLGSLVDKRVLKFRRDGKRYLYRPAISSEVASQKALSSLLQTFFGGKTSSAVAALLDVTGNQLTDNELLEIKRMIDQRRKQNREDRT